MSTPGSAGRGPWADGPAEPAAAPGPPYGPVPPNDPPLDPPDAPAHQTWSPVPGPAGPPADAPGPPPRDWGSPDWVSPDWAPPRDRRPGWLPGVVLGLVLVLLAGSFAVADRSGRAPAATAALAYLPADGAVDFSRRETVRGSRTTTSRFVTESALLSGAAAYLSVDSAFAGKMQPSLGAEGVTTSRIWRSTTTEIGSVTSSAQTVAVHRVDGAVELVGESGAAEAHVYTPALVELPADVAPGARWSSQGRAGDQLTYASSFTAESAEDGCLRVQGTIAYDATTGQRASTRTLERLWCRGTGLRAATTTVGDTRVMDSLASRPAADPELRTETDPFSWTDPAGWRQREFTAISNDPTYGGGPMPGSPGAAPPVVTASGLVVRPTSSDDLVAFTPKTATEWTSVWRMHPGGRVLSLTGFGDVLVVTTSNRQVVAYTDGAVRLWQRDLTEVAFAGPVRTSATEAALVDASGHLQVLDLRTGEPRWQRDLGTEVQDAPAASATALVVVDGSGTVTGLAPGTGEKLWRTEIDGATGPLTVGDTVVVRNAATLEALALDTGRHRWLYPLRGTLDDLRDFGGRIVVATQLGTTVLAEDGSVVGRRPAYERVTAGSALVGWGRTRAEVLDPRLHVLSTLDTPDLTFASGPPKVLAYRQGVWLFHGDWSFTSWSDEP